MRFVTYNFCRGGRPDFGTLRRLYTHLHPDMLFCQETCNPYRYFAEDYAYWRTAGTPWHWWQKTPHTYWGSALYTRLGLEPIILDFGPLFQGWVVGMQLRYPVASSAAQQSVYFISIHNPTRRGTTYAREMHHMLDTFHERYGSQDLVLAGDFNMTVSHRHPDETRQNTADEVSIMQRLETEFKVMNCWQCAHPDRPLAQTFHGGRHPAPAFHIDGIFVPQAWKDRLLVSEVVSPPTYDWHEGDHFPLVADFAC